MERMKITCWRWPQRLPHWAYRWILLSVDPYHSHPCEARTLLFLLLPLQVSSLWVRKWWSWLCWGHFCSWICRCWHSPHRWCSDTVSILLFIGTQSWFASLLKRSQNLSFFPMLLTPPISCAYRLSRAIFRGPSCRLPTWWCSSAIFTRS